MLYTSLMLIYSVLAPHWACDPCAADEYGASTLDHSHDSFLNNLSTNTAYRIQLSYTKTLAVHTGGKAFSAN